MVNLIHRALDVQAKGPKVGPIHSSSVWRNKARHVLSNGECNPSCTWGTGGICEVHIIRFFYHCVQQNRSKWQTLGHMVPNSWKRTHFNPRLIQVCFFGNTNQWQQSRFSPGLKLVHFRENGPIIMILSPQHQNRSSYILDLLLCSSLRSTLISVYASYGRCSIDWIAWENTLAHLEWIQFITAAD